MVAAEASPEGGPTTVPLIADTLYVYSVSGFRPVCEYVAAAVPVSAAAVLNSPPSPSLNSTLYPVTAGLPCDAGLSQANSICPEDLGVAFTLAGLPGGLCATTTCLPPEPSLPDSLVSVTLTSSDPYSAAPTLALTTNRYFLSVSRSLIVCDVSLPPASPIGSPLTPLLNMGSISYPLIGWPYVWDGGSQSRRTLVADSSAIVTCVGLVVCAGFARPLSPE